MVIALICLVIVARARWCEPMAHEGKERKMKAHRLKRELHRFVERLLFKHHVGGCIVSYPSNSEKPCYSGYSHNPSHFVKRDVRIQDPRQEIEDSEERRRY